MSSAAQGQESPDEARPSSYARFGHEFFRHAVTAERIAESVRDLAGRPIEFGPMSAGPGRLAKVSARGAVGDPVTRRIADTEPLRFRVRIPVNLRLTISLGGSTHRFRAEVVIPVELTARAVEPLRVHVDASPPEQGDIDVTLHSDGVGAGVLRRVAGIEDELRRFVARYVATEIDDPRSVEARHVDIASIIERGTHRSG
ncbi:hypothetical protein H0B56_08065 [Haloechinothrix sp. YIM 98757]|uniref:Uncharacterized protein n=1 Tax=Haloechinothrix aidingensis TaxID=2752311 RepID=A0A838A2P1_9PSEU|nr:hypothetical protein [Haloechinothrix aidingensis]MBA0125493.1 hypothetical protein [Haloechinothrix aidingensis]